jgi:hypothetical protein
MRLPWWFWVGYADVAFWYVTIPLAIGLGLARWYAPLWLGGLRWVLHTAAVLLVLPFPATLAILIYQKHDATRYWRTLESAEAIAGLTVPAGSKVHFADKSHSIVVAIELPHATEIRGIRLSDVLLPSKRQGDAVTMWGGDLAEDQRLDGLPCRAGPYPFDKAGGIKFDDAGTIHRCTLASEHELLGLKLPPGTTVSRGDAENPWSLLLPADTDVYIPVLQTMAPGGVTLDVADDGRLLRIGSGHGQTIVVHGVPLNSKVFELQGEVVGSELAEPFAVAGEMRPASTAIRIHLATGDVSVPAE